MEKTNTIENAIVITPFAPELKHKTIFKKIITCLIAIAISICAAFVVSEPADAAGPIYKGGRNYYGGYYTSSFSIGGHTAYCLQPKNYGPTWYNSWTWATSNQNLCAAMYFGYGGPGFNYARNHGWWPTRNQYGGAMSASDYYAATHVLVSYIYGGRYAALYGTNSSYQNWASTYIFGNLYNNIAANAWQVNQTYRNGVWIAYTGARYQDIICADNWTNDGGLTIHKKDSATGQAMGGIRFDIYTSNASGGIGSYVRSITTNSAGQAWTGDIELPAGYYRLYEVNPPSGYAAGWVSSPMYVYGNTAQTTYTVYNTKTTSYQALKRFVGTPAPGAKLTLLQNGVPYSTVTLSAKTQYYTWYNLPYHNSTGAPYTYSVREDGISNGYVYLGGLKYRSVQLGNTISNIEMVSASATKVWNDATDESSDWDYRRSESVKVQLNRISGTTTTPVGVATLSEENGWTYTWNDLPKGDSSGNIYTYRAVELFDDATSINYRATYSYVGNNTTITNTLLDKTIKVSKRWIRDKAEKPETVTFNLYANNSLVRSQVMETDTLENTDSMTFEYLPLYDASGNRISYSIAEQVPDGWASLNDIESAPYYSASFTNISTECISIPVIKKWVESNNAKPETVIVKLFRDGIDTGDTLSLTEDMQWQGRFEELPKYDMSDGHEYKYTVEEEETDGWTATVQSSALGFTITNAPAEPIMFIKKWTGEDFENIPSEYTSDILDGITVEIEALKANGMKDTYTVELKGEMNPTGETVWKTQKNIPTTSTTGAPYISYEIKEKDDLSILKHSNKYNGTTSTYYYSTTICGNIEDGEVIITNTLKDKNKTNISVRKTWELSSGGEEQDVQVDLVKLPFKKIEYTDTKQLSNPGNTFQPSITGNGSTIFENIDWTQYSSENKILIAIDFGASVHDDGFEYPAGEPEISDKTFYITENGEIIFSKKLSSADMYNGFVAFLLIDPLASHTMYSETVISGGDYYFSTTVTETIYCNIYYYNNNSTSVVEDTAVLSESNNYQYNWTKEVISHGSGNEYFPVYVVKECSIKPNDIGCFIPSYQFNERDVSNIDDISSYLNNFCFEYSPQYSYNIDNIFIKENIDIPVHKIWNDEDNVVGIRPDSVTVNLFRYSQDNKSEDTKEFVGSATLSEDNDWSYVFGKVKAYDAITGENWVYEAEEEPVPQYDAPVITGNYLKGFTVNNSLSFTSVKVDKSWNDFNDAYQKRPQSITVNLLANGTHVENQQLTLNSDNAWKGSFENLPVYDADGTVIEYTVEETNINGYTSTVSYGQADDKTVYVVLYTDGSLCFYNREEVPGEGDLFQGKIVEKVYIDESNMIGTPYGIYWQYDAPKIKSVEIVDSGIVLSSMWEMFSGCYNLKTVSGFEKFSIASYFDGAVKTFYGCSSLKSVDGIGKLPIKTTNGYFQEMFSGCSSLEVLNLSSWTINSIGYANLNGMFYDCTSLNNIVVPTVSGDAQIAAIFANCSNLAVLDLSNWNINWGVAFGNWSDSFSNCSNLHIIYVSPNTDWMSWARETIPVDPENPVPVPGGGTLIPDDAPVLPAPDDIIPGSTTNTGSGNQSTFSMFSGCTSLVGGDGTKYIEQEYDNLYACVDGVNGYPGYFTVKLDNANTISYSNADTPVPSASTVNNANLLSLPLGNLSSARAATVSAFAASSTTASGTMGNYKKVTWMIDANGKLTIDALDGLDGILPSKTSESEWPWYEYREQITSVQMGRGITTLSNASLCGMFFDCQNVTTIDLSKFNTSNVINMESMFYNCSSLTELHIESFDTQNVTTMTSMFQGCSSLESIDVSNFNTSKITDISYMFYSCNALKTLNLSNFQTSSANLSFMFEFCNALQSLTISSNFIIDDDDIITFPNPMPDYCDFTPTGKWISADATGQENTAYTPAELKSAIQSTPTLTSGTWMWEKAPSYTVRYDSNNQLGSSFTQECIINQSEEVSEYTFQPQPGMRFVAWNTSANASGSYYAPGNVLYNLAGNNETIVLYAIYQPITAPIIAHITNTLDTRSITVNKQWDSLASSNTPSSVNIALLQNGKEYAVKEVSENNGWMTTFDNLPVLDAAANAYVYMVKELPFEGDESNNIPSSNNYTQKITSKDIDAFTITNVEQVSFDVVKEWNDSEDADELRPDSVNVNIIRESNEVAREICKTITLSDTNKWCSHIENLDRYDSSGNEYIYYVEESMDAATAATYISIVNGSQESGFVITNVHERIYKEIEINKRWNDDNDRDKIRPETVTVQLLLNGVESPNQSHVIELSEQNNWHAMFTKVPIYDENGQAYEYSFEEVLPDDVTGKYTSSVTYSGANTYTITNSHTPTTRTLDVEKVFFNLSSAQYSNEVVVHVLQNGKAMSEGSFTAHLNESNHWKHTFELLPIYDDQGNEYEYTIEEDSIDGFVSITAGDDNVGFTITNYKFEKPENSGDFSYLLPESTIDIALTKLWEDDNNKDESRPDDITVHLWCSYGDTDSDGLPVYHEVIDMGEGGKPMSPRTISPNENGLWVTNWKELPAGELREIGDGDYEFTEYSYKITEDPVDGYEIADAVSDGDGGFILINTKTTEQTLQKDWNDGDDESQRPDSIGTTLIRTRYANGAEATNIYTFLNMETNEEISRLDSIGEGDTNVARLYPLPISNTSTIHGMLQLDGSFSGTAKLHVRENGTNIRVIDIPIADDDKTAKTLFDIGDIEDSDANFLLLSENGEDLGNHVISLMFYGDEVINEPYEHLTLSRNNGWKTTLSGLYDYDVRGLPQKWSLEEDGCYGYSSSFEERDGNLVLTNALRTSISIKKQWLVTSSSTLPDSVEVELIANGIPTGNKTTLSADNGWEGEFAGIRWRDGSGKEIEYTARETNMPDGFVAMPSTTASLYNDYTITLNNIESIDIPVQKIWSGDEGNEALRPEHIDIGLDVKGTRTSSKFVPADIESASTQLSSFIADMLSTYDSISDVEVSVTSSYATPISFYISTGDTTSDILVQVSPSETKNIPIKQTFTAGLSSMSIKSFLDIDAGIANALRQGTLSFSITATGETNNIQQVRLAADNNWQGTFKNLPIVDSMGNDTIYSVNEISNVPGYSSKIVGDSSVGYQITNAYGLKNIPVTKVWKDEDNKDQIRPESIIVALFELEDDVDGSAESSAETIGKKLDEIELSAANDWKGIFTHVNIEDTSKFTVREVNSDGNIHVPDGYISIINGDAKDGFEIVNVHETKTEINITKIWDDGGNEKGTRPSSITVRIFKNEVKEENEVTSIKMSGNQYGDSWNLTISDLPYADESGKQIHYVITEDSVSNYETSIKGTTITNYTEHFVQVQLPFSGGTGIFCIVLIACGIIFVSLGSIAIKAKRDKDNTERS